MSIDNSAAADRLARKANQIRQDLLNMIYAAKTGHTGSSLSCADIMTVLFYDVLRLDPKRPDWPDRDRFILSKGHAVEGYYCILADLGFFPKEELKTFSRFGSRLIGHPNNKVPGVEMNTGALGHGLSISVGMAIAARKLQKDYRVYTLMGDGEQAEGSVWEAAMAAAHYKLDNLVAILDRNRLQISGCTEDVMSLEPLDEKWRSFGWSVVPVDGHDHTALSRVLHSAPAQAGKPTLILARTVKGRGVSFMENVAHWHHGVPTEEQMLTALTETGGGTDDE
ncbi:MAG: transketolase [Bacillota bacterium]|nr:transketolase [Bacillota bacterium]